MNKTTIAALGAFIASLVGAAQAETVVQALGNAGVQGMARDGRMELSVDQLYTVTQAAQRAGLEISVVGTSPSKLGTIQIQIGEVNKLHSSGIKVFTPKTIHEITAFGPMVAN